MQTRSSRQHRTHSESSENSLAMTIKPRPWGEAPHAQAVQRQPGPYSWRDMLPHDPSPRPALNFLQAKLTVGAPNDVYEQEADRVAEQVMSTPDAATHQAVQREAMPEEEEELQMKPLAATITPLVQREAMPEEEEELQTKSLGNSIQREAIPEEEEELQTKPLGNSIQREAMPEEEEEIQTKALSDSIQREAVPEEEEEIQTKRLPDAGFQEGNSLENRLSSSQGGGSPLSEEVRSFMEPRFGADFSQVRVHTSNESVQMNRDLSAQAFTHGQDIYFGNGKAPDKDALTAHELTHVVQQTGDARRKCSACDQENSEIMQRKENGVSSPRERFSILGSSNSENLNIQCQPTKATTADIPTGDPDRRLTWADFKGPAQGGNFAAETRWKFVRKTVEGKIFFQAKFQSGQSWVVSKYKNPTNRQSTGCGKLVSSCKKGLKNDPTANYQFGGQPDPNCAGAVTPKAVQANSVGDCESIIGAECDRVWQKDSIERLLPHEQLHFDIARTLAERANDRIKNGDKANDVEKDLNKQSSELTEKYDSETQHGCKAGYQAAWNAGLY